MLMRVSFLINLLRVVVVLFVFRLVMHTVAALFRKPATTPRQRALGEEMVRDRVCNTFLPRERALREVMAGEERFFCSTACRDRAREQLKRAS
jgi:uncharacterized protein